MDRYVKTRMHLRELIARITREMERLVIATKGCLNVTARMKYHRLGNRLTELRRQLDKTNG